MEEQSGKGILTREFRRRAINELISAGKTYREIMELLNVSPCTIRKYINKQSSTTSGVLAR